MLSHNFISYVERTLKAQLREFTRFSPEFNETALEVIAEFLLDLDKNRGRIYDLLTPERKKEKVFMRSNGNIEVSLTMKTTACAVIRLSILQTKFDLVSHQKILTFVEKKEGFVYFLESEFGYKIGMTKDITKRLKTFDVKLPFDVFLRKSIYCADHTYLEKQMHELLSDYRINGEWFNMTDESWILVENFCNSNGYKLEQHG